MADTRKKTSGRKTASRQKTSGKSTARKRTRNTPAGKNQPSGSSKSSASHFSWGSELLLFVILAFCVVLFLTNIGKGGVVGEALSHFFFGLFGVLSYPFPVLLFFICAFLISNRISHNGRSSLSGRAVMKICAAIAFYLFLCVFACLVYKDGQPIPLKEAFLDCAEHKAGGGLLGACIANGLIRGFGILIAYVIDFIVLVFCVVLLTEKSMFRGISTGTRRLFRDAKDRSARKYEKEIIRSQQEEAERLRRKQERLEREARLNEEREAELRSQEEIIERKKKGSGVSFDTQIRPESDDIMTDDLSEIDLQDELSAGDRRTLRRGKKDRKTDRDSAPKQQDIPPVQEIRPEEQGPVIRLAGESAEERIHNRNSDPEQTEEIRQQDPSSVSRKRTRNPKQTESEVHSEISDIEKTITDHTNNPPQEYHFPVIDLLKKGDPTQMGDSRQHLQEMSAKLQKTLETFGVNARVTNVICGPSVTQYEIHPEMGVKVSKILNLADDIKLNLAVSDIRIEAPIPGKAAIGIEVPNKENVTVAFRDLIESREFQKHPSRISFCAGKDIAGNVIVTDIAKMPHLLIAGATGSGKSVCINTIIMSILYKARPDEVKLIMIDPKVVELSVYNNIPHLLIPVVTDPKKAAGALHWAVAEMTDRYNKFAEYGVRDIKGYNQKVDSIADIEDDTKPARMPQIVVIVDELADLMMVAPGDVEDAICRLAQLARAAGIHLIIATQRPSVNVITGLIKANMPSRIAFSVTSGVDSRTILDMNGAEKLLGKGDMLFYPQNFSKPLRVQGAFVSDKEVSDVVEYIIEQNGQVSYNSDIAKRVENQESQMGSGSGFTSSQDDRDTYFAEAGRFIIDKEKGSIGMLQRNFKIGFNRAARIMDQLEEAGVVGPEEGTKPRRVLMTAEEFEQFLDSGQV